MEQEEQQSDNLKHKLAGTIKWNAIDRVATQILYAVTGIVLANLLSKADFGLVGAIGIFQAFATLFVDSGFNAALIQRKSPTKLDYSTVLWFNLTAATAIYIILFMAAPYIAELFENDRRLIPLSRVMFLTFIINAAAIVQTNLLVKQMQVKMIAVSNSVALIASAAVGIWLAVAGYGAWAIVWQSVTLSTVKTVILWATSAWRPLMQFSMASLRSFFRFGSGVMASAFLNVAFQEIYSFFIGNRVGLVALGYYNQAHKWSRMGIASISQMLSTSFLPALSAVQDDAARFAAAVRKMNRFTAYLLFPALGLLGVMATPIFHTLFGTKWDGAIPLFQILLVRGVFTVLQSNYNSYIMALGRSRLMMITELLRDGAAAVAIAVTLPYIALSRPDSITAGLEIFLWGQLAASVITWAVTVWLTAPLCHLRRRSFITDLLPALGVTVLSLVPAGMLAAVVSPPLLLCCAEVLGAAVLYLGINAAAGSEIQREVISSLIHRGK